MLRQRLTYIAMSLFVAWHTLAMVVAPAPDSYLWQVLRIVQQPYLTLFRLDNQWDFFAPDVGEGSRFRYVIEDKDGQRHSFDPADRLSWFHPAFFWMRSWYYGIIDDPGLYGDAAAARLCKQHADLEPLAVTFYDVQEERFRREDLLAGKSRSDPEFFTIKTVKRIRCPSRN